MYLSQITSPRWWKFIDLGREFPGKDTSTLKVLYELCLLAAYSHIPKCLTARYKYFVSFLYTHVQITLFHREKSIFNCSARVSRKAFSIHFQRNRFCFLDIFRLKFFYFTQLMYVYICICETRTGMLDISWWRICTSSGIVQMLKDSNIKRLKVRMWTPPYPGSYNFKYLRIGIILFHGDRIAGCRICPGQKCQPSMDIRWNGVYCQKHLLCENL